MKPLKKIKKEIRRLFKANNQGAKEVCFEAAIWMNSFLGVFIPCCYIQRINDQLIVEIENMEIEAKAQLDFLSRSLEEDFSRKESQDSRERFYKKRLRQLKKKYDWTSEIDLPSRKRKDKTKSEIKEDIKQLRQRPSILERLDSLRNKTQEKIQKRQEWFGTSVSLLSVVLAACLVNFYPDYKYSVNKLNNFNFNIFVSIALSLGFFTLSFTFLSFDFLSKENPKKGERKKKRKCSQPTQALLSFLLSLAVFSPILCGGFLSSTLGPGESFAIVISDQNATESRMDISFFKIFPVNDVDSERGKSVNRGWVRCREYQNEYLKADFIRSGPVLILANLDNETECALEEKQIRHPEDLLLLGENWNNRSSSPFPDKVQSKYKKQVSVQGFKGWKKIPVFSLGQKDLGKFEKALQSNLTRIRTIEKNDLPAMMRHDSDLFTVNCNEIECLDITRSCANDNFDGVFLGFRSMARRNVKVSISCSYLGRPCKELKQKKNVRKVLSECQNTVTPEVYSTKKLAMRCIWNKTNEYRALTDCGRNFENLQHPKYRNLDNRCCSRNQTNIFFREGCQGRGKSSEKELMLCHHEWSSWSAWSTSEQIGVFTR